MIAHVGPVPVEEVLLPVVTSGAAGLAVARGRLQLRLEQMLFASSRRDPTATTLAASDADEPARGVQLCLALAFVMVLVWAERGRQVAAFLLVGSAIAAALPGAAVVVQDRTYYGVTRVLEDSDGC